MSAGRCLLALVVCVLVALAVTEAKSIDKELVKELAYPAYEPNHGHQLDMMEDDGTAETELLNFLFARQMMRRLKNNLDVTELQRKRSYWKQCSFNAVSCFG